MKRIWLRRTVKALAVIVLLAVAAWTFWNWREGAKLRATLQAQRERGYPMTLADIVPPPVPDEQNAALVLNRAFLLMTGGKTDPGALLPAIAELKEYAIGGPKPEKDLTKLDADAVAPLRKKLASAELAEIFKLLDEASARPACRFGRSRRSASTGSI